MHRAAGYDVISEYYVDDMGKQVGILQLMTKLNSTNMGHSFAKLAIELIGDDGLMSPEGRMMQRGTTSGNSGWVSQYMYSLGIAIAGGTANIQRNIIAERGLGLPRDAAAQRS